MKSRFLTIAAACLGLSAGAAWAAIPADAPYNTDTSNEYVQDRTSEGINNLNMVMCIVHGMSPAQMLNEHGTTASDSSKSAQYIAMVDMNKCDNSTRSDVSNSSGGASGSTSAPNYIKAVVTVSRASNDEPMIAEVFMHFSEDFGSGTEDVTVYAHLSATQSPTDVPPYGEFRLDYIGKLDASSATTFNGFIDSADTGISYLETGDGGGPYSIGLILDASSTSAGSGTMDLDGTTFDFGYNGDYFLRDDSGTPYCFDRDKTNANKSVWRYGTYDAATGERVTVENPGFPITADDGSTKYYGYAGYWGIDFQGLDVNTATLSNYTITDQRAGNDTTYTVHRVAGKLTKWTQNSATLDELDGIPVSVWADMTGLTTGNAAVTGSANWVVQWDTTLNSGAGAFKVVGKQTCGNSGCFTTDVSPVATIDMTANALKYQPLQGWSDSFGGNITIPPTGAQHDGADDVYYYTQSVVIPGSAEAPANLYCLNNCPTSASLGAFDGTNSPFGNNTDGQWFMADSANTVDYTFDDGGLKQGGSAMTDTTTAHFTGQWQGGIMTGRLFDSALDGTDCPSGMPVGTVCEPANPTAYYTWQTGPQQWSQSLWLTKTSDSSVVSFDPPQNVQYTVTAEDTDDAQWIGKTIMLQFNGFGDLWGIPGHCVDPSDNSATSCDTADARYVPEFALHEGATMTLGSTSIIVKPLDAELRLSKVSTATCTGAGLTAGTTSTLPTAADLHDPTDSTDSAYIGTEPDVTGAPSVIDGVLQ